MDSYDGEYEVSFWMTALLMLSLVLVPVILGLLIVLGLAA